MNVNFHTFTVGDTLDFISYFAFKCNGTSLIAEIHRRIMANLDRKKNEFKSSGSMYSFLCGVNKEIVPAKAIGSCTENRFMFSGGSSNTVWNEKRKDLLRLCMMFFEEKDICAKAASLKVTTRKVIQMLLTSKMGGTTKKVFGGVGAMGANHFIHMSALLGLIPLACYNLSSITDASLGPGTLINNVRRLSDCNAKKLNSDECHEYMISVHRGLSGIWGDMVTENLVENKMCVLHRSYERTKRFIMNKKLVNNEQMPASVIKDDSLRKESRTADVLYMDERRDCIQSVFAMRMTGNGMCYLRPQLCMKFGALWRGGEKAHFTLTNYRNNGDDKKFIGWGEDSCGKMRLDSTFNTSDRCKELFKL